MPALASTFRAHLRRWWTYQRERFPLHAHGPLVAVFSFASVAVAAAVHGTTPSAGAVGGAFVVALAFFWMLRVADEFKDASEDRRHRPHRPVPRGLIGLRELGVSGVVAAGVQLVCVVALAPAALPVLVVAWAYFALMSVEFFAPRRLAARPALYLVSHAVITPLIAAVCAAFVGGAASGVDVAWLLAASLFGSLVIEIGRKLRAPSAEQPGVETYTKLWGSQWAVSAWLAALIGAAGCAVAAGGRIGGAWTVGAVLGLMLLSAAGAALRFLQTPEGRAARWFEPLSGAFVLGLYGTLAVGALLG
jgi:4-hydroxybenzoate polyprenyltransferase